MTIIRLRAAMLPADYDGFLAHYDEDYAAQIAKLDRYAGSFDNDAAQGWDISSDTEARGIWLTPSGRWVYTSKARDCYLTVAEARAWLAANGRSDVIIQHIDREQDGPGRPEIGPEIKFRVPVAVRDAIDALAEQNGVSRADQLRMIVMDTVPLSRERAA